ncbi:MAG: zinc ribbon domain-containing protein [Candidatus Thorarchaeota archaeon]
MAFWVIDAGKITIAAGRKCPNCTRPLLQSTNVCPYCKKNFDRHDITKMEFTKDELTECPNCRTLNTPNRVTCENCGENFVAARIAKPKNFDALYTADKRRKRN